MSQLPEVREADAPPHIKAIYEDIKASAELPQVNLIFRYLATKEGTLEWVWQSLRPLYRSQELAEAAAGLTRSIERPGPSPLHLALDGQNLKDAKTVIDSYNSGNPQNLIALTALVHRLQNRDVSQAGPNGSLTPRAIAGSVTVAPFPALPRRETLSPAIVTLVEKMAARHPRAPGVIPSMYLHLALWPGALEAANIFLQPLIESPAWRPLVNSVIADAGQAAIELAPYIQFADNPPDDASLREAASTIEAFINQTIPELVTVGRLLEI